MKKIGDTVYANVVNGEHGKLAVAGFLPNGRRTYLWLGGPFAADDSERFRKGPCLGIIEPSEARRFARALLRELDAPAKPGRKPRTTFGSRRIGRGSGGPR